MSKARVSAVVAVAASGTVTVAAGCGGSASAAPCRPGRSSGTVVAASAPRHLSVVGAAATKTQRAGSARVSMTMEATTLGDSSLTKKPWASVDVDKIFPGPTSSSATTANDSLQELEQAGTFHRVGVRRVRGVETNLYSGTIAAGTASARLPKRLGDALNKEHVTSIPTRAWIDRTGFVRKLTESVNGVVVTIELYDFGVPVDVTAPSPTDVQDLTSKFKSVLGG